MYSLYQLVDLILNLYTWVIIAQVILSWLVAFNVINTHNQFINMVGRFLYAVTEPVMRPIRNFLPALGGIDLSPLVVLLGVFLLCNLLWEYWGSQVV